MDEGKSNPSGATTVPPGRLRRWMQNAPKYLVSAVLLAALIFLLFIAWQVYQFISQFNDAVELLSGTYGFNVWAAKLAALILVGPLAWGAKQSLFGDAEKRLKMRIGTGLYACVYFAFMWWVSSSAAFSHKDGTTLQWYASTPEGVRFFTSPGFDPKYGMELKPVTPALMVALERRKRGIVPKQVLAATIDSLELFDPLTGEPKYTYALAKDGSYRLFDGAGFDPQTQALLQPLSHEVAEEVRAYLLKTERDSREAQAAQIASRRVESLKPLFACSSNSPDGQAVGIGIAHSGPVVSFNHAQQLGRDLAALPSSGGKAVRADLFRNAFFESASFSRAIDGEVDDLKVGGAFGCAQTVLLGKLRGTCSGVVQGVRTCDLNLDYRALRADGQTVGQGSVSATAAGFDENEAISEGIRRMVERHGERVLGTAIK